MLNHKYKVGDWVRVIKSSNDEFENDLLFKAFPIKKINNGPVPIGLGKTGWHNRNVYWTHLNQVEPYDGEFICDHAGECDLPSKPTGVDDWCSAKSSCRYHKPIHCSHANAEISYIPYQPEQKEETMKRKYEYIPPVITMASIDKKGPCKDVFLRACRKLMKLGHRYTDNIPLDNLIKIAEDLGETQWLVDNGFIREVEGEVRIHSINNKERFIYFKTIPTHKPIFAKKNNKFSGMLVKEDDGWILRIGERGGANGHHKLREHCISSCCREYGYEFFVED